MRRIGILGFAVLFLTQSVPAQEKKLGVGVVIGLPTGFSVKYWQSSTIAYQGALGGSFGGLAVGADYLIHSRPFKNPDLPFYYGPGIFLGEVGIGGPKKVGTAALGVRAVFGVDYVFPQHPFDIALELGPALFLTPVTGIGVELGVAFRFYP
ncbi:MAG TPA: hypothetical protein VNN76_05500 [Bacteroidota bacterium]|nr:hypothetical protein [Bacteroidota bacterium]